MSAYALTILTAALVKAVRSGIFKDNKIIRKAMSYDFTRRYLQDDIFRVDVGIYRGLTANFLYMLFRLFTGIRYGSVWFISVSVYYMVLGILRTYLVLSRRKALKYSTEKRTAIEYRCYRRTGWLLFLLNIPMGGMTLMIQTDSTYTYPGYVIYVSAIYTFYAAIISVINTVKFHGKGSPILSAAKVLNLVAAMMSVLGLQTAMISQFSVNGESYCKLMNTITGVCVFAAVTVIAFYMLINSKVKKEEKHIDE